MIGFSVFAGLQILASVVCLYLISKSALKPIWEALALGLVGLVVFGASLRIAWDVFGNDAAFYLSSVIFPYSSGAMVLLVMLAGGLLAGRAVSGGRP